MMPAQNFVAMKTTGEIQTVCCGVILKILICDDSEVMLKIITRMIRSFGWPVTLFTALDGHKALLAFRKEQPDLVITDWNMPAVDGLTLISAFKRNGIQVPIGMITGNGSEQEVARVQEAGAAFVITKPFLPETLKAALEPYIDALNLSSHATRPPSLSGGPLSSLFDAWEKNSGVSIVVAKGQGCPVNGSAGAIYVIADSLGNPIQVVTLDWSLVHYLSASLLGDSMGMIHQAMDARRMIPQIKDTAIELGNHIRGVFRDSIDGGTVDVQRQAFRGDGELRTDYWKALLTSPTLKKATELHLHVRLLGVGEGQMSIYRCAT